MGTNAAGTWNKAANLLQDCIKMDPDSAEARALLLEANKQLLKLQLAPTAPKSAWKKLVHQYQVRFEDKSAHEATLSLTLYMWASTSRQHQQNLI